MADEPYKAPQASPLPFWRWCLACSAGELLGLGGAFGVLAAARVLGADGFDHQTPAQIRAALGFAVGILEGGLLGTAQALVLTPRLPNLPGGWFAAATALPAAIVWAVVLAFMNSSDARVCQEKLEA
jgi:hypothetical protein